MTETSFEKFLRLATESNFTLALPKVEGTSYAPLENDALFHLPFISVCVLVLAKGRKKGLGTAESGRLVGELIEATIPGFKGSSQMLGWSATLRQRTAEAIVFLESIGLISVGPQAERKIEVTEVAKTFLARLNGEHSHLGQTVRGLRRNIGDVG